MQIVNESISMTREVLVYDTLKDEHVIVTVSDEVALLLAEQKKGLVYDKLREAIRLVAEFNAEVCESNKEIGSKDEKELFRILSKIPEGVLRKVLSKMLDKIEQCIVIELYCNGQSKEKLAWELGITERDLNKIIRGIIKQLK